jgi:hypothetical protein
VRHHYQGNAPSGESACNGEHNRLSTVTYEPVIWTGGVGLFWGAQFIDPPAGFVCMDPQTGADNYDYWSEPMSKDYYRPHGSCAMRWETHPYCGACEAEIARVIEAWPLEEIPVAWLDE